MTKIDVDYSKRPNKSLIRSRILDITEKTFNPQHVPDEGISYITFSGYSFIDSIEFYKRFNIRNIYSIENNDSLYRRAKFNRPYVFFDIMYGGVTEFIDEKYRKVIKTQKVIYLDYQSRLRDNIISDLEALFSSGFFNKNSLLFITLNRGFNKEKLTPKISEIIPNNIKTKDAYKTWLSEQFSNLILYQVQRKYKDKKVLQEVLKVFYHDTADMVVFGYLIKDRKNGGVQFKTIQKEEFALPVLTFLEENYIRNNFYDNPCDIADRLGLQEEDVLNYIKYKCGGSIG